MRFWATCQRSVCEELIWVSEGYFPNFSGLNSEDSSYHAHYALILASCAQQDVCANPLRISHRATIKSDLTVQLTRIWHHIAAKQNLLSRRRNRLEL